MLCAVGRSSTKSYRHLMTSRSGWRRPIAPAWSHVLSVYRSSETRWKSRSGARGRNDGEAAAIQKAEAFAAGGMLDHLLDVQRGLLEQRRHRQATRRHGLARHVVALSSLQASGRFMNAFLNHFVDLAAAGGLILFVAAVACGGAAMLLWTLAFIAGRFC